MRSGDAPKSEWRRAAMGEAVALVCWDGAAASAAAAAHSADFECGLDARRALTRSVSVGVARGAGKGEACSLNVSSTYSPKKKSSTKSIDGFNK
jgi:hypothetical protein